MAAIYEDTKLHEAARFGDIDLFHSAMRDGVDPNAIGLYEWTALHEAAVGGEATITTLLLENGADPSARDLVNGSTPMHLAANQGNLSILRLLVENGGNIDLTDDDGKSVIDVADDVMCKKFLVETKSKRDTETKERPCRESKSERAMSQLHVGSVVSASERVDVPEILLSVEYNSKSGSMKTRVRKLRNMRRPDGDLSTATALYVKSYLVSSSGKHESKQKTDDIALTPLEDTPTHPQPKESLLPEMEFSTPLEYTDIQSNKLSHYSIVIAVCCYSGWPFATSSNLASMSLPLKTAVKTIMPTWFGLQPCIITQQPKPRKLSQKATVSAMERPRKPMQAWVGNNNSGRVQDENSKQTEQKQSWKGVKNVWLPVGHPRSEVKAFSSEKQLIDVLPIEAADHMLKKKERNTLIEVNTARPIESFRINRSIPDPFAVPSPEKPVQSKKQVQDKPPVIKTRASAELIDIVDEDLSSIPPVQAIQDGVTLSKAVRFNTDNTVSPLIIPNVAHYALPNQILHSTDGVSGRKMNPIVSHPPQIKTRQSATLIETDLTDDYICEYLKQDIDKKPKYCAENDSTWPRVREGWT
jgi:hypothetical protein